MHVQVDLECEFGYEYSDGECKPIVGVDTTRCGPLVSGLYTPSDTHKRLIHGDNCSNIERLITDTDGMGHRTGDAPSGKRSVHWGVALLSFLVRLPCKPFSYPDTQAGSR